MPVSNSHRIGWWLTRMFKCSGKLRAKGGNPGVRQQSQAREQQFHKMEWDSTMVVFDFDFDFDFDFHFTSALLYIRRAACRKIR